MSTEIIIDYEKFLQDLEAELDLLTGLKDFNSLQKLPSIIARLQNMLDSQFIPRTCKLIQENPEEFKTEVSELLDDYFESFHDALSLLEDFKHRSGDFFSLQKAYQLSHVRGVWRHKIHQSDELGQDVKDYFLSGMFVDAYELLPLLLRPILTKMNDESKVYQDWPEQTSEQYLRMGMLFDSNIFDGEYMVHQFRKLRNQFSHSKILFKNRHFHQWTEIGRPSVTSSKNLIKKLEYLPNLIVIFATEIDLRILRLAKPENNNTFKIWIKYFENYVHWFLKNSNSKKA